MCGSRISVASSRGLSYKYSTGGCAEQASIREGKVSYERILYSRSFLVRSTLGEAALLCKVAADE